MARITLEKVKQMSSNGELELEGEMIAKAEAKQEKLSRPIIENVAETKTSNKSLEKYLLKKATIEKYEDLAKRIEELKKDLNLVIDNVNDENLADLSKNLIELLKLTYTTVDNLELDPTKAKQSLKKLQTIFGSL